MNFKKKYPLFLIVLLLPLSPLLFGYFPATGDMRDVFIPLESFFREQQLQWSIPSWDPAVSFGFPVLASAQIGFFYPPLFILRFLPVYLELPLVTILHILAAAIGTFLFARKIKFSFEAAIFTTLAFVLSQFVWQHVTHLNIFLAISWFPWQMLAAHTVFQKKMVSRKDVVVLSVLFGIPFLIGQLQMQLLMMSIALLYGIYISPPHMRGRARGSVVSSIIVLFLSLLIASVQLFPTVELAQLSSRASAEGFDIVRANQHSYPLYHFPTLVFPRFYGNDYTYWGKRLEIEYGSYIGVIPLLLAVWYIWNFKRLQPFWTLLLGVTLLLSLGSLSPFRLIGIEPSLWFFSAPARWLLFTTFAASILAGYGFDALANNPTSAKKFFSITAIIGIAVVLVGNIALYVAPIAISKSSITYNLQPTTLQKLSSMLTSAKSSSISLASPYTYIPLISLTVFPFILNRKKYILALVAIDLIIIAASTSPFIHWKTILTPPETISQLPQSVLSHNARIYSLRDGGDTGAYFTDPASRADDTKREQQRQLLLPMVGSQFGIYGVQWPASLDLTSQTKAQEMLPQGAEDLAIGAILSANESGTINVQELNAKPRVELVTPPYQGGAGGGLNDRAEIISETPTAITIRTNASKDSTLILRDTYYPGWHAYVDDKEAPLTQVKPFFRAVQVPSGEHTVTMEYVPTILYAGGIITLIILLICAIIFAL